MLPLVWMSLSFIRLDLNNFLFFRTIVQLFVFGFQGTVYYRLAFAMDS